jgi:hypothetical protein
MKNFLLAAACRRRLLSALSLAAKVDLISIRVQSFSSRGGGGQKVFLLKPRGNARGGGQSVGGSKLEVEGRADRKRKEEKLRERERRKKSG